MNIPHSAPWISADDISSVSAVLARGMLANGVLVQEFEAECQRYLQLDRAWATTSGQAALVRALLALGVGSEGEVVMPTYVCQSVADAVRAIGARPVYCDVGEDWCINAASVSSVLSSKTVAIVAVHAFGVFADVQALLQFGVPVIEDCCQCFSPQVGAIGAVAIYSLHATKCLTGAEGGLIATAHPEIAKAITNSYERTPESGRFSDLQAALALSQLRRYPEMLHRRALLANTYFESLPPEATKRLSRVKNRCMFFRFPLSLASGFDAFSENFQIYGVTTRRGVDQLLHRQQTTDDRNFPVAAELYRTTLSLPLYPSLQQTDLNHILEVATKVLA
ncbi:DegT/DnrJ/EryC1/StrS family aminotransferase [Polaromonas aquatica]|uniref:DegT/DnrJ/EryC1/StrS family aminotransferase n=1 Tax=Polaromonas aquatica TaxID=332657 RepID=UPI003D654994